MLSIAHEFDIRLMLGFEADATRRGEARERGARAFLAEMRATVAVNSSTVTDERHSRKLGAIGASSAGANKLA